MSRRGCDRISPAAKPSPSCQQRDEPQLNLSHSSVTLSVKSVHANRCTAIYRVMNCRENTLLPFWATVCKTVRPILSDRCPVSLSVTLVYCGQMVGWIKMKLGMEVGLGPSHTMLDGDPASPEKGGTAPPNFRPVSIVDKRSLISATACLVEM